MTAMFNLAILEQTWINLVFNGSKGTLQSASVNVALNF